MTRHTLADLDLRARLAALPPSAWLSISREEVGVNGRGRRRVAMFRRATLDGRDRATWQSARRVRVRCPARPSR